MLSIKTVVLSLLILPIASLASAFQPPQQPGESAQAEVSERDDFNRRYVSNLVSELQKAYPKNRTIRMVFHGHSVPAGYFRAGNVRRFDSYPVLFHEALCKSFPTAVIDVCTTAIGGENSERGAARFEGDVLSLKPDVVFIDYSLNDRAPGLEAAGHAWRGMIRKAQAAGVSVVLLTPTPDSRENILDDDAPLAHHARQVRKLGREFSIPVIDSFDAFRERVAAGEDINAYLSQANHPNRAGHLLVARLLERQFIPDQRPNVLWIMAEDISTDLACYGHPAVKTPNLDRLASQGRRYTHGFCTAPSCTPSRNAMMTGVYQTRTDTQDQRRRGIVLPKAVKPITHRLQEAGYYTAVGCGYSAKTDLNFQSENLFDGEDWKGRGIGQPFFAQITLGVTHRHGGRWPGIRAASPDPVDPAKVRLPPYFPDHPMCRQDWALYLDAIEKADGQVGQILARLDREGIADNTIVIFTGDNGRCHLRGKCWLYDAGLRVPLLIRWPAKIPAGEVNSALVSTIDVSATILDSAGITLPSVLDGFPLLGPTPNVRDTIFAARDQIDEVIDHIRCVRTQRYKYIRNYTPENGYRECQYVQNHRPMLQVMKDLHAQNLLTPAQQLILAKTKPVEELYDVEMDPYEIKNLAGSPEHEEVLSSLRVRLDQWIEDTSDTGLKKATIR